MNNDSIYWFGLALLATALMWIPYILNAFIVRGVVVTMGYATDVPPASDWAVRAKKAHYNAVENLVVFAPLVVVHAIRGNTEGPIAIAAMVYFFARTSHYLVYSAKVPFARTGTFLAAWGATIYLAINLVTGPT